MVPSLEQISTHSRVSFPRGWQSPWLYDGGRNEELKTIKTYTSWSIRSNPDDQINRQPNEQKTK